MSYLIQLLYQLAAWFLDAVSYLAITIVSAILTGLATVFQAIPAPGFFSDAAGYIGSIPPLAAYLISALEIPQGITIVVTALTLRFVIRRIPLIG